MRPASRVPPEALHGGGRRTRPLATIVEEAVDENTVVVVPYSLAEHEPYVFMPPNPDGVLAVELPIGDSSPLVATAEEAVAAVQGEERTNLACI